MNELDRFGYNAHAVGETAKLPLDYQAPKTVQPYTLQCSMTGWRSFFNVKPGQLDELRGLIGQYRADWPGFEFRIVELEMGLFISKVLPD